MLWPVVFVVGHVATLAMGVALTVVAALVVAAETCYVGLRSCKDIIKRKLTC